ncbi:NUDIX domain-containing protein [archaeon]|nr:NUDIX domain-containing protein [archaeon]
MKCIICGSEGVKKVERDGDEYYLCDKGHLEPRVKLPLGDFSARQTSKGLAHVSVGAVIKDGDKVLLINRRKYPFAYTIPAGHLEEEEPEKAVRREVEEETGLEIKDFKLVGHYAPFYDPCRGGADYHEWYLFGAEHPGGDLRMDSEGKDIGFYSPEEIKSFKLTIPTRKFLKELGIVD